MEIYDIAIIPLIMGIVEVFKRVGLPKKFAPLLSLILGLLFGIFYMADTIKEGIIIGLMLGLSANGLFSSGKNMTKRRK